MRRTVVVDIGIAAVLFVCALIFSPGAALLGIIALVVVVVCGVSYGLGRWSRRRGRFGGAGRGGGTGRSRNGGAARRRRAPARRSRSGLR